MGYLKVTVLMIMLCLSTWAAANYSTSMKSRQDLLNQVKAENGPIASRQEYALMYRQLDEIFGKLVKAHNKLKQQKVLAINEIYIVESLEENAFVGTFKEPGSDKAVNMVFVNMGLIQKVFEQQELKGKAKTWKPVTGTIAHELAHPFELYEEDGLRGTLKTGIGDKKAREEASQALEDRADTEALEILREAKYPPDCLLERLEVIAEKGQYKFETLLDQSKSTHPDENRRLVQHELLLTLNRYERGGYIVEPVPSVLPGVLSELKRFQFKMKFKSSKDISETLTRLEKLPTAVSMNEQYKIIEFNRLLLTLGEQLMKTPVAAIGGKDQARLRQFLVNMWKMDNLQQRVYPRLVPKAKLNSEMGKIDGANAWSSKPDFLSVVQTADFFKSPQQIQWANDQFKESFETIKKLEVRNIESKVFYTQWLYWAPMDIFLKNPTYKAELLKNPDNIAKVYAALGTRDFYTDHHPEWILPTYELPTDLHIDFAHWFMKELFLPLSKQDKHEILVTGIYNNFWGTFQNGSLYESDKKGKILPGIGSQRVDLMFDPLGKNKRLLQKAKEMASWIWQDKAFYALYSGTSEIEWPYIFELLGIDKEVGYQEIKKSIKEYTVSDQYVEFLTSLKSIKIASDKSRGGAYERAVYGDFLAKSLKQKAPMLSARWATKDLLPYLGGDKNPKIASDPELKALANRRFRILVYAHNPFLLQTDYEKALIQKIKNRQHLTLSELNRLHDEIVGDLLRINTNDINAAQKYMLFSQVKAIASSLLSQEDKKKLVLRLAFGTKELEASASSILSSDKGKWLTVSEGNSHRRIAELLIKNNFIQDYIEVIERLVSNPKFYLDTDLKSFQKFEHHDILFKVVDDLSSEIINALEKRWQKTQNREERKALAKNIIHMIVDPGFGVHYDRMKNQSKYENSAGISKIRAAVAKYLVEAKELSFDEAKHIFLRLTNTGATKETDEFYQVFLRPELSKTLTAERAQLLEQILNKKRIRSAKDLKEIADRMINPMIASSLSKPLDSAGTIRATDILAEKIQQQYPKEQGAQDQALEALAWKVAELPALELKALIESRKSTNYKRIDPSLANKASAMSALIASLSEYQRSLLLQYIIGKGDVDFPETIRAAMEAKVYESIIIEVKRKFPSNPLDLRMYRLIAKKVSGEIQMQLEKAVMNSVPYERIPIYALILRVGGHTALVNHPKFPLNISNNFLNYETNSMEEILLLAYFDTIPSYERAPTLAYLLSQIGEDKSSIVELFSVFQTVGIKGGQLTAVFKILGEKIAQQTEQLQDDAKPLSLQEVKHIFETTLSADEFSLIKRPIRILGSASVKVVVLVELQDGTQTVAVIRRPNAEDQVRTNMDLIRKFLVAVDKRLRASKKDYDLPVGALNLILRDIEVQMTTELDFKLEALNIEIFKKLLESYNSKWSQKERHGLNIKVPAVDSRFKVRSGLMFLEYAKGKTWRKLRELKASGQNQATALNEAGHLIVNVSLDMLFEHGIFNADQHGGQALIDESNVHFLDFGQGMKFQRSSLPWSSDDRYVLAQFFIAAKNRNVQAMVHYLMKMQSQESSVTNQVVEAALYRVMKKVDNEDMPAIIRELVNEVAKDNFLFKPQFSVGAFKGLLILEKQGYVSAQEFRELLTQKIKKLILKKAPLSLCSRFLE